MATRCQIGFYEKKPKIKELETNVKGIIYRHWDGYPDDGGVLEDIVPFLTEWNLVRGISDYEYTCARLLQYLTNLIDKKDSTPLTLIAGTLGYGISNSFHQDIEYYYAIYPSAVDVYEANIWNKTGPFKLIKTINIK